MVGSADSTAPTRSPDAERQVGGKYLTFHVGGEEYGVGILQVREIIGIMEYTEVPQTSEFVSGVVNLRGRVLPIIDLRSKFGFPPTDHTGQTCIVVVDVGTMTGIIVDAVQEVHDISAEDIQPPPRLGGSVNTDFLLGMGRVQDEVKMLLDIDKVLANEAFVVPVGAEV